MSRPRFGGTGPARCLMVVVTAGLLTVGGCIRNVPTEKTSGGPRPKIAEKPVKDKLAKAVNEKNGDVIAGLQVLLGPLEPGKNRPEFRRKNRIARPVRPGSDFRRIAAPDGDERDVAASQPE